VAKLKNSIIRRLRPLPGGRPFGIFFVEFSQAKLPVVVLRRPPLHPQCPRHQETEACQQDAKEILTSWKKEYLDPYFAEAKNDPKNC
jgi:hypothetical protein